MKVQSEALLDEFYRAVQWKKEIRREVIDRIRQRIAQEAYSDDGVFLVSRLDYILNEEAAA